jgi:hypothetical protein
MSGQFEEWSRIETTWDRCRTNGHTANGDCQIRVGIFLGLAIFNLTALGLEAPAAAATRLWTNNALAETFVRNN